MNYWKLLPLLLFASPAFADDDALMDCRKIDESEKRLACFDEYVDSRFLTVEQIKEESVIVTKVSQNSSRKLTLTLENGQIWRQVDSKSLRLKKDDAVVIRAASLGSFLLSKESGGRSIRVTRVN